jgi:thiol-disulfide isomerase/thioredoxin
MMLAIGALCIALSSSAFSSSALAGGERAAIAWRKLEFDGALSEAAKQKALIFVDFSTSWCGYCRKLEAETFPDPGVVAALQPMVCLAIDAESTTGRPVASRYGVTNYPTLLFLEPDGSERDRIAGFLPAQAFKSEVERIARNEGTYGLYKKAVDAKPNDPRARLDLALKLRNRRDPACDREYRVALGQIAKGDGFDASSTDARWQIAQRLRAFGDVVGAEQQLAEIKKLDPDGKSLVLRRLKLQAIVDDLNNGASAFKLDTSALRAFLAEEKHEELLFDGLALVRDVELRAARDAQRAKDAEHFGPRLDAGIRAAREAWKHCPADKKAPWARECATKLEVFGDALTPEGRELLADLAAR